MTHLECVSCDEKFPDFFKIVLSRNVSISMSFGALMRAGKGSGKIRYNEEPA